MRAPTCLGIAAISAAIALAIGCGGTGSSKTNSPQGTAGNVQPISVSLGPNGNYANGLFTSVTICVPGSSNCQTISDVLVDTGSSGLRLLSSAVSIPLPQQLAADGKPVAECLPFLSGYTWGPVQTADVVLSSEKASSIAVQVLSDTALPVAAGCKDIGLPSQDTVQTLGANGILGVGELDQDCPACSETGSANPGLYYECGSSTCQATTESLSAQVRNPVASFPTDNNGVAIALPSVDGASLSANGSLIFGIGTESNNGLGSAQVYTTDQFGNFTTTYKGNSYPGSFIDSGSNGLFFLDSASTGVPVCGDASGFYCPASTQNLSAQNSGTNGTHGTVNFSIANADSLFSNSVDAAFADLGGPSAGVFDWGVPFFFGRTVFTAITGKSTPAGTGPYWAY